MHLTATIPLQILSIHHLLYSMAFPAIFRECLLHFSAVSPLWPSLKQYDRVSWAEHRLSREKWGGNGWRRMPCFRPPPYG